MPHKIFPTRIETDRLVFDRLTHDAIDPFDLHVFVTHEDWQGDATDTMPWFRFDTIDDVAGFIDHAETQWTERESARYLLSRKPEPENEDHTPELIGLTAYVPTWNKRYASSDVVIARSYWGEGYGTERAAALVELAFDHHDLDAYCTSCATDNDPSRRMIEKLVDRYGGQYDGRLRQYGSPRPDGTITDQHRYSILREEYDAATENATIRTIDW